MKPKEAQEVSAPPEPISLMHAKTPYLYGVFSLRDTAGKRTCLHVHFTANASSNSGF